MYSNYHWCRMIVYEKIADELSAAARDRLALTAAQAGRESQRCERARLVKLLWALASAFGLRRLALMRE